MKRILLVEDDRSLGQTLKENLELENYRVDWLQSGAGLPDYVKAHSVDLIVLDVMLPVMTGLEALKEIRKSTPIPVMMISAKGSSQDRIQGLELKADDYLGKPFHLKEFLLRIQALLRRSQKQNEPSQFTEIGRAKFDLQSYTVETLDGEREILSAKEIGLIKLLLHQPNKVVSREEIINTVWGSSEFPTTRTVDNFIVKLRKLIEEDPSKPEWIISHRGIGYSLRRPL
jgi:two-component system alkaline phosphatase synthesis response regulator PhoP